MESKKHISNLVYILPVLWAVVFRCAIALYPHSGQEKAPLFGDFEAQRHWMEVTINLPLSEWYHNSDLNDLNYWGLDYPPLTAYHSYFLGHIARARNSSWTELISSRGTETPEIRTLMRTFVLFSDFIVFLPVLCFFFFKTTPRIFGVVANLDVILCTLFYPGIVLIDHGHFQYNCVSLGLFLLSSVFILHDYDNAASLLFSMALGYKQMELYHALPIFSILLARSLSRPLSHFLKISITVVTTFFVLLLPFILVESPIVAISQILTRLFPVSRGIFEDKVSNLWCSLSVVFKWQRLSSTTMVSLCVITTFLASIPSCIAVLISPRRIHRYLYASLIVSLAFFLFSYQVHEKSILMPAVSAILLSVIEPFWSLSFLHFSTLSMWPLLVKDGLAFPTLLSCSLFLIFFSKNILVAKKLEKVYFISFNLGYVALIALDLMVEPPLKYPFLYPLLISQWSCFIFLVHFFYFNWRIFTKK